MLQRVFGSVQLWWNCVRIVDTTRMILPDEYTKAVISLDCLCALASATFI